MALNITVPARLRTAWVGRQAGQTDAQAAAAGATAIRAADIDALDAARVAYATALLDLDARVGNPRGTWAASTAYAVGDIVTANGSTFRVTTAHTSGSTSPTASAPGANLTVVAAAGAPGTGTILEVSQTAYDALTATQKAAAYYAIVPDNNLAADTQSLLNAGNLDRFALRGTGGALSATTIGGVGAVQITAGSSPSRDLGAGTAVAVTPGRSYAVSGLVRHVASWGPIVRVDVIWRTSADAAISTVGGTEVNLANVGGDVTVSNANTGAAPANAASMELRFRNAHSTTAPGVNGAISVRNLSAVAL